MAALDEQPANTVDNSDSHPDNEAGRRPVGTRPVNRRVVALVAVLLTVLVAGVVGTVWLSGPSLSPQDEQFLAAVASSPKLRPGTEADAPVIAALGRGWCASYGNGVSRLQLFYTGLSEGYYSGEDLQVLDQAATQVYCPQYARRP